MRYVLRLLFFVHQELLRYARPSAMVARQTPSDTIRRSLSVVCLRYNDEFGGSCLLSEVANVRCAAVEVIHMHTEKPTAGRTFAGYYVIALLWHVQNFVRGLSTLLKWIFVLLGLRSGAVLSCRPHSCRQNRNTVPCACRATIHHLVQTIYCYGGLAHI